ncbi:MAG: PIN domain-containing protein [candidate division NC10 bacterium]
MGQLTLPASGSVYIDADAVIYSVEKIEPYWTLLQPMWSAAKAGQFAIIGSELLLLETLVKPFQTGDTTLEKSFRDLLMNAAEVRLVPMSITVLESAARLRAQLGLRTPDAIHAQVNNCGAGN